MNKAAVTRWIVRGGVLSILAVGLFFGHKYVLSLRDERALATNELEAAPERLLESARQRADLSRREVDIGRVERLLVPRSEVVAIVARIEQEATARGLTIAVPAIEEIRTVNAQGEEVESAGPARDVRLEISVDGPPEQIVAFVHSIEHLPYLLHLESWRLTNRLPVGDIPEATPLPAQSSMHVIVAVAI